MHRAPLIYTSTVLKFWAAYKNFNSIGNPKESINRIFFITIFTYFPQTVNTKNIFLASKFIKLNVLDASGINYPVIES